MPKMQSIPWAPFGDGPWERPACPPTVTLPAHADVVVVGAGVTGLSAALRLAETGCGVVIIDRTFGDGAACRSGGIVLGDTLVGAAEGFQGCEEELRDWVLSHDVRGGLDWCGCIELDRDAARSPRPIDWRDAGVVRAGDVVAGGTLDPAALVEALAREAYAHGVRFVNGADVASVEPAAGHVDVLTRTDRVQARAVVVTTDAAARLPDLDPWPVRAITVVVETAPASLAALRRAGWPERQPFYTNDLPLLWGRRLPSGGLLVGRELLSDRDCRPAAMTRAVHAAGLRLAARIRGLHPAFVDVDVARVWAGPIARTAAGVPSIHVDTAHPHVVWAGGYGGHGLAQAFRLGRRAAEVVPRT